MTRPSDDTTLSRYHPMTDTLKKFLLADRSVRVGSVQLHDTWQHCLAHHDYHPAVQNLLGELVAAATLLASSLKFDGSLLLQIQGTGPIRLLVVECRADMSLRTTVKLSSLPIHPDQHTLTDLINPDGLGRFVVILNPPEGSTDRVPYQGVIGLEGQSVAQVLEFYMQQSEQLQTRLWLACDPMQSVGLLIQKMPSDGGHNAPQTHAESWSEAVHLCETLTRADLLTLDQDTRIHRLFWQTPVMNLEDQAVTWRCGCTRGRVISMLQSLGQVEVESICAEQGRVTVSCEFCGTPYVFEPADVTMLFAPPSASDHVTLH